LSKYHFAADIVKLSPSLTDNDSAEQRRQPADDIARLFKCSQNRCIQLFRAVCSVPEKHIRANWIVILASKRNGPSLIEEPF